MSTLQDQARAAETWWRSLGSFTTEDGRNMPGDRATLARLRRCSSPMKAAVEPATAKLFKALALDPLCDDHLSRAAALAAILAHVRENGRGKVAHAIGVPAGGEASEALLKPNRFRTLMGARTGDEILTGFRRVVAILGGTANVHNLALQILSWTDDEAGDRARTRFAFDYHGASDYAPRTENTSPDTITEKA